MEKIEVLIKVADDKNVDTVLEELKEYTNDIDSELVQCAVKAIGHIILRVERGARRAVEIIKEIAANGTTMALQEAVIVAKDIFRKFPNKYDGLTKDLCKRIEEFTEPESKAAIIWVVGEYAERIEGSENVIQEFCNTFLEEPTVVQLSLLTASVKLYLKKPDEAEDMIESILKLATEEADNPDLRDRAYVYWRLLSADPEKTKEVVLSEKPNIAEDSYNTYSGEFVDKLIDQISSLSSIFHKTPEELIAMQRKAMNPHLVAQQAAQEAERKRKEEEEAQKEQEEKEAREAEKAKEKEKKKKKKKKAETDEEEDEEDEEETQKKKDKKAKKSKKSKKKKHESSEEEEEDDEEEEEQKKPAKAKGKGLKKPPGWKKESEDAPAEQPPAQAQAAPSGGIDLNDLLGLGSSQPVQQQPQPGGNLTGLEGLNFG